MTAASTWFLYIIECADGRLYTGITTNVERRFDEHANHKSKGAKALRGKGPLTLVLTKPVANRSVASVIESRIKKMSRKQKLELIAADKLP